MADPGDTIYPTVAEIRAFGVTIDNEGGLIGGLDYDDTDYQYSLHSSASYSFSGTAESAREQKLVDTDLHIEIRVPGVDQTTCDDQSQIDYDMLDLEHRDNVGIYGPSPAHTHESWDGTGGVDAHPSAGGVFNVTASGTPTLTLALASGYETRLDDIPSQIFPEGMDGAPLMYWYRKADLWHAYDGQNGGDPPAAYSVPHEAVYCWLGWSWLKIPITAPEADSLTLTVVSRHYSFTDNHLSDSTRQTEFEYAYAESTHTYTVAVSSGANNCYVNLIGPAENEHPIFDRVVSIAISGFADGEWTIAEPTLVLKVGANGHCNVKTFEGYEYHKGGFSCHVDSAYEYGAGDDDHGNLQEWAVPFFDYLEGAESGLDLTAAYSLTSFADIIENTSDAWTCDANATNLELATKDGESPANQLDTWDFDFCYPGCTDPTTPLEQDVDGATANCSLRVGTWTIVAGLTYCMRTDKVVHGRAHGRAVDASEALISTATSSVGELYRHPPGSATWEYLQDVDCDEHGHWVSHSLPEIYDGTSQTRWTYGIIGAIGAASAIIALGNAYTREYLAGNANYAPLAPIQPHLAEGHVTDLHLWFCDALTSNIYYKRKPTIVMGWTPRLAVASGQYPWGEKLKGGELVCCYQSGAGTSATVPWKRSLDLGANWGVTGMAVAGQYPIAAEANGIQYLITYTSGTGQIIRRSQNWFSGTLTYAGTTASALVVGAGSCNAERLAFLKLESAGRILTVGIPNGASVDFKRSKDDGQTWSALS